MSTLTDRLAEALRLTLARAGDYLAYSDEVLAEYDAQRGVEVVEVEATEWAPDNDQAG